MITLIKLKRNNRRAKTMTDDKDNEVYWLQEGYYE